ncbi:MAG: transglycosylase domain-containing protein [Balneolaceae bacterium]|nr:transglycosylase domain-containing protein [Balneolaceae bacterium]MCH8549683.1 transglycosylase domain-containing protein [Balneolaceae bacterium]
MFKKIFLYLLALTAGSAAFILFLTWYGFFGPVPDSDTLSGLGRESVTKIYTADGIEMGSFAGNSQTWVTLDEIAPELPDALLAIEDIRFYDHNGIDRRALARVAVRTILLRQNAGGGSTITQQLAKNLYPRGQTGSKFHLVTDKIREMIIAHRIESIFSKKEVLELYLNTVSFGEDTFGIDMASRRFFSKPPSELTVTEAATLSGLLQATTFYNPRRNPERAEVRRNVVLRQMERYGMITTDEAETAISQPLAISYSRDSRLSGLAPYFRDQVRRELARTLETTPALDGKTYSLQSDALVIHTTLDSELQHAAERAVARQMKELQAILDRETNSRPLFGEEDPDVLDAWTRTGHYRELKAAGATEREIDEILHEPVSSQIFTWDGYRTKTISPYDEIRYYLSFLNAGFVAMDPLSGDVKAWVGGIDHRHFPFDQVRARRQPGSAFKPVLYAAALESGRSPCDYQRNMLTTYAAYDDWTPRNTGNEYGGRYSLKGAMAKSVNTVAVNLATETGMPAIRNTARNLGISSSLPDGPSVALGTGNLSLLELTASYTAFLNGGVPVQPRFITKIYNQDGELIYDFSSEGSLQNSSTNLFSSLTTETPKGISPETAGAMVDMLRHGVETGTGRPLKDRFGINGAVAGKTGTTQNFTDGWFVGFTPNLVFGTRVGGANNRVRFHNYPAYASQTALPVAGHFLKSIEDRSGTSFSDHQLATTHNMTCEDQLDDRFRDRVRDFFSGQSSDEPRVVDEEKEESRNVFRRLGRRLGID